MDCVRGVWTNCRTTGRVDLKHSSSNLYLYNSGVLHCFGSSMALGFRYFEALMLLYSDLESDLESDLFV